MNTFVYDLFASFHDRWKEVYLLLDMVSIAQDQTRIDALCRANTVLAICSLERVFENDKVLTHDLINTLHRNLLHGVENYPYSVDLTSVDFNLNNRKINDCLWTGFNRRGLYRMRQFYETYKDNLFVSPLVTQISWTNHLIILSGTKTIEEKELYISLCIKGKYSKRELERPSKEDEVVEFAMSRNLSSTMVAEYSLKLIDKKLLEQKLREYKELLPQVEADE